MDTRFKNIMLKESIVFTLSKMLDENHNEKDIEIIAKTMPQFKRDLASMWNNFDFNTQKEIAKILPESWKWDIHVILTESKISHNI